METFRLNTNYDLEYYKKENDRYSNKLEELYIDNTRLYDKCSRIQYENYELLTRIIELEKEIKKKHVPYTVKLQIAPRSQN